MYIAGTEITISWIIPPSVSPLAATDYDIRFFPADLNETYTDGAIVNYVYPSEFYSGSIQYVFTPLYVGLYQVYLTTGTADSYQVLDRKTFWCFEGAPQVEPSLDAISPGSTSGPLWVAPIIPIFPSTYMLCGAQNYEAHTPNNAAHMPTQAYEYIWGGRSKWQTGTRREVFIDKWNAAGVEQSFIFYLHEDRRLRFIHQFNSRIESTVVMPMADDELVYVKGRVNVTPANRQIFLQL